MNFMWRLRADGMTRAADGEYGLVVRNGTNLRYTDLAPGARAPMVLFKCVDLEAI